MADSYFTPGVYVKEIPSLPATISPVATAVPVFIGCTEKVTEKATNDLLRIPRRITSLLEFTTLYGGACVQPLTIAVEDTTTSAGLKRSVSVTKTSDPGFYLAYAVQLYFANGGGPCYIVTLGGYGTSLTPSSYDPAFAALKKEDEPTLVVIPDKLSATNYGLVVDKALQHCAQMQDRFLIADVPASAASAVDSDFRSKFGNQHLSYGAAYFPWIRTGLNYTVDEAVQEISHELDGSAGAHDGDKLSDLKSTNDKLYKDLKASIADLNVEMPPSGAVAGVYASVDRDRGVWKAPANVSLANVLGPVVSLTNAEQDGLNVDATSGKSVNAIRAFTGKGTLIWGARTLAGNDNEWRYVPVRRLFLMIEESIAKATQQLVFEPNDANTWLRAKGMIGNFLNGLWRAGALAGAKPQDAYFVNCGLGTSMSQQDILEGNLIIEVGIAAVRPAEFIVLKFSHKVQES
jgi:phage tail sheath protein FI